MGIAATAPGRKYRANTIPSGRYRQAATMCGRALNAARVSVATRGSSNARAAVLLSPTMLGESREVPLQSDPEKDRIQRHNRDAR